jgi:hypothetical protein
MSRSAKNKRGRPTCKRGGAASVTTSKPRGNATRAISTLGWSGTVVLSVGLLGWVAGFATIPFLGYAPENPFAELAIAFLIPGLCISLALYFLHGVIRPVWVDDGGDWVARTDRRATVLRILLTVPLALFALGVALIGLVPLGDFVPWVGDLFAHHLGPVVVGLILSSVVLAAVAGAAVMGGWRAAIIGVIFGFGFIATVFGKYTENGAWTVIGWSVLALALAGFYLLGEVSGHLPRSMRDKFGSPSGAVLGAVVAAIGFLTGQWLLGIFGAGCVAAWLGIWAARRWRPATQSVSPGD